MRRTLQAAWSREYYRTSIATKIREGLGKSWALPTSEVTVITCTLLASKIEWLEACLGTIYAIACTYCDAL